MMKNMLMRNSSLVHVISIYNIFFKGFLHKNIKDYIFFSLLRETNNLFGDKFVFYPLLLKNMLII